MEPLISPKSVPALKGVLFISILASILGFTISFFQSQFEVALLFGLLGIILLVSLWLYKNRYVFASITISVFAGLCSITIFSIIGKGFHDPIMIFFPAILIFSSFIFRNDVYIVIGFVTLFLFNVASFLEWNSLEPHFNEGTFNILEFIFYNASLVAFAIVGKLLYLNFSENKEMEVQVKNDSRSALLKKNKLTIIAIVEDNQDVSSLLQDEFESEGYTTIAVDSADALQDWIEANGTNIHLVITDFYLNMSDGRMVIETVRKMIPHIPIILISGYPLEELSVNLEFYNDVEFVPKPFTPKEILEKAEQMLKK